MTISVTFGILLCLTVVTTNAQTCLTLGIGANFTVIAAQSVTNTGSTIINGNLAISPGTSLTGFYPPGVINGGIELGSGTALQAQKDVTTAYNYLQSAPLTALMTGMDLSGKTLGPGVYKFDSTASINTAASILTLNGTGTYIFQVGTGLNTAANSAIQVVNGAVAGCIFWQVGSSATLGQNSIFVGNILAYSSITFSSNITYNGAVYAQTGAITFISDTINIQQSCNVCSPITATIKGQASSDRYQNISIFILTILLVFLFQNKKITS